MGLKYYKNSNIERQKFQLLNFHTHLYFYYIYVYIDIKIYSIIFWNYLVFYITPTPSIS